MKKILVGIVGVVATLIGLILAITGTMYEVLPGSFRYASLAGIFLFILGLVFIGAFYEYPDEDILS